MRVEAVKNVRETLTQKRLNIGVLIHTGYNLWENLLMHNILGETCRDLQIPLQLKATKTMLKK